MQELHERYYEPLAAVQPSLDAILQGPPVKKLLFMTDADVITRQVIPHWQVRHWSVPIFTLCLHSACLCAILLLQVTSLHPSGMNITSECSHEQVQH